MQWSHSMLKQSDNTDPVLQRNNSVLDKDTPKGTDTENEIEHVSKEWITTKFKTLQPHNIASPEYESNIIIIYFCIHKESSFKIHSSELVISCNKINTKIVIFCK